MIVIIGASASGKTEIAKVLKSKYHFDKCITTTTREKRIGEKDGFDYHFISEQQFLSLLNNDKLVEHANYNNNYYGLQKIDLKKKGLVIMEPSGANELIKLLETDVFVVFVNTKKSIRKRRMEKRGDLKEDILKRLKNDKVVFNTKNLMRIDLKITNNSKTIEELAELINNAYNENREN